MTYEPFSVVVVPFPFTDSADIKKRPALVISSKAYQQKTKHITLLMITSAKHSQWYGDHPIIDLDSAGLRAQSIIRQKIFTLDIRLIIESIGKLKTKDKDAVSKTTRYHFNFY